MELRVCPSCNKAFYAQIDGALIKCNHCDFVLLDRRSRERTKTDKSFKFFFRGKMIKARVTDYSDCGVKMVYKGGLLGVDEVVALDIGNLDIHAPARAVWTKKTGVYVATGLKFA